MPQPPPSPNRMRRARALLFAFALAALVTYIVAAVLQTSFVLAGLHTAGADFTPAVVVTTIFRDLYGLAFKGLFVSYLLLVAVGLAIALSVAALVRKWTAARGMIIYPLAAAVMMAVMLSLIKAVFFGITLYAGSRGAAGLAGQMFAGACGGVVFALCRRRVR